MPTTRTPIKRKTRGGNVTPQVIAAYRRALALHSDPRHCNDAAAEWSGEYREACWQLHELLGRHSGDVQVFDTIGDDTGDKYDRWGTAEEWKAAISLRLEIERASDAAQR